MDECCVKITITINTTRPYPASLVADRLEDFADLIKRVVTLEDKETGKYSPDTVTDIDKSGITISAEFEPDK